MANETTPYADIGNMLRQARERLRIDRRQAADALHIRAAYLEALEEGRFSALPGLAYAKGYLQTYAMFLQLDRNEVIGQFERVEASLKRGFFLPSALSSEKKPSKNAVWGGLVFLAVGYVLWLRLVYPATESVSVIDTPPKEVFASAAFFNNPSCFQPKAVLYPPCYEIGAKEAPKKRPVKSFMDLAQQN